MRDQLAAGLLSEEALLHVMQDTASVKNREDLGKEIQQLVEEGQNLQNFLLEIHEDDSLTREEYLSSLMNIFKEFMNHVKQRNLLAQQINNIEHEEILPASPPEATPQRCLVS